MIQDDRATRTVGATTVEAQAGQVVIVPPETPHKFVNSGEGKLRQIDIHASKRFITEWLEDEIPDLYPARAWQERCAR